MDFIASYTRAKLSKNQIKRSRSCGETSNAYASTYLFLEDHPLVKTHGIRKRNTTVIPDIIGPRLPDRDNLDTADQRETYGLMALLLFYPFQLGTDLKQGTGSYWTSFQMFSKYSSMTRQAQEILENLQEYFVSKRRAAREREVLSESRLLYTNEEGKDETHGQRFEDEDDGWADCEMAHEMRDQGVSSHLAALNGFQESCSPNMVLIANKIASKQCVKICGSGKLPRNATLCPLLRMEGNSQSFEEQFPHPIENLSAKYEQVSLSYLKNGEKVQNETEGTRIICNHQSDADTTISLLEDALKEMSDEDSTLLKEKSSHKKDNTSLRSHCGHFPSISSVANKCNLNNLQEKAFSLVAKELLRRFAAGYSFRQLKKTGYRNGGDNSFKMYLGGEGGTGKTRVIEALLVFCRSWLRPRAMRTCAPTGIAASLVQGQTLHSLLGIRAGAAFNPRKKLPTKVLEEHEETMILIIDEVSMLSRSVLASLDAFFRKVKEREVPFGGISGCLFSKGEGTGSSIWRDNGPLLRKLLSNSSCSQ